MMTPFEAPHGRVSCWSNRGWVRYSAAHLSLAPGMILSRAPSPTTLRGAVVTQQIYPGAWSEAIHALRLDLAPADPPLREVGAWRQVHAKFTKRGFMRALLGSDGGEPVVVWVELLLPGRDAAAFAADLNAWASEHGAASAAIVEPGPPAQLRLEWASGEGGRAMETLTMLLKLGDYLGALEQDAHAPSPLVLARPAAQPSAPAAPAASAFEPIGAVVPTPVTAPAAAPSAFEVIGAGAPAPSGALRLMTREVSARGARITARLGLSREPSHGERAGLRDGMSRALRVRFDVEPRGVDGTGQELVVELDALGDPGLTTQLVGEVAAFFARLIELGALGLGLEDAVGGAKRGAAQARHAAPAPSPVRDAAPSLTAAPVSEGVVLDLGGGSGQTSSAPEPPSFRGSNAPTTHGSEGELRAKDFGDARLKRADATTPLVDVVLRHPGYAERATAQALGILLSVEHHKAQRLVESAPCVIAWGVGRDQAQTLKTVVEGAGGKVVLVEPGTFGQR
jgi:hypothetical protein